jgi:TrmH family RNA methyltransferase
LAGSSDSSEEADPPLHEPTRRRLAEDVVIVLVEPQQPGNVGGVARAMMNMGLRRLVLVDPSPAFNVEKARWMAPGAEDILRGCRIVATLDEALEGVHRVVGTTARHRADELPVLEPRAIATSILDDEGRVTAILFGREDFGLSRRDTGRCECLLRIATDHHASLNLAAAVLIVAHHLFEEARARGHTAEGRLVMGRRGLIPTRTLQRRHTNVGQLATVPELEPVVHELIGLLEDVRYTLRVGPERVTNTVREALQRANLTRKHLHALRGVIAKINWRIARTPPPTTD